MRDKQRTHCSPSDCRIHKRSLLKPIPLKKYDGKVDAQVFHRFMTQATEYITDGQVPSSCHISIVSNFLSEKAYTFYTCEVALRSKKWRLDKFFTELFNYYFPTNFQAIQCQRLEKCCQGNQSVKEYVSQLNELFTTIQKALWKDKLNPDSSSFSLIVKAAELNEIADSIVNEGSQLYPISR
ncbi:hypothetical protein P691DRAFT_793769 [Macrolepiota fuliginosa MF-IS2]|uniref:Retrotransposon gag domain-containing protein n=1 Tax=Macrolepiota fuliginosa MF-IS2 TaxID=1400762 RepID=A0A9P5WWJ1_9AGAR|nr:hypothetical protein P691DRAFT_793769 [Macrolepiota fuliginosa MF-IS2]